MDDAAVVPTIGFYARLERLRAEMKARTRTSRDAAAMAPLDARWWHVCRLPVLVHAVPGFADLWRQVVPDDAIERAAGAVSVVCRCGGRLELPLGVVVFCDDACGRWFLRTEQDVRVKVWPREAAA